MIIGDLSVLVRRIQGFLGNVQKDVHLEQPEEPTYNWSTCRWQVTDKDNFMTVRLEVPKLNLERSRISVSSTDVSVELWVLDEDADFSVLANYRRRTVPFLRAIEVDSSEVTHQDGWLCITVKEKSVVCSPLALIKASTS